MSGQAGHHGLRGRFRSGITWNSVAVLVVNGATFAVTVLAANMLGKRLFGAYAVVQSTLMTVAMIATFATGAMTAKYVAEFRSAAKERAGRVLALCQLFALASGLVAAGLVILGRHWLAAHVLREPALAGSLAIAAAAIPFLILNAVQTGALVGLEQFKSVAQSGVWTSLQFIALAAFALWAGGMEGAFAAFGINALSQFLLLRWHLGKRLSTHGIAVDYRTCWKERNILHRFALPAAMSGFTAMPALWLANVCLVRQADGYSQMAEYGAANTLRLMVLILPNIVSVVGLSMLNYQKGLGDDYTYRRTYLAGLALCAGAVLGGVAAMLLAGPWLLAIFGKGFGQSHTVLLILLLSTLPEAMAVSAYQVIQSQEKMWLSFFLVALPRDGAIVFLAAIWAPVFGAAGLACAYAAGWLVALLSILLLVRRLGLKADPRSSSLAAVS